MASQPSKDNLEYICDTLAPVMAAASIGEFTTQFELKRHDDPRVSELLMGYQVLLDVIRQQAAEIDKLKSERPGAAPRTTLGLLDDLLQSRDK